MSSIIEISHAIRDTLSELPSPTGSTLQVFSCDELPKSVNSFPTILILPGPTDYHADYQADVDYIFRVIMLVDTQDQPSSLARIMPYIEAKGDYSVNQLIGTDVTLGGVCATSHLTKNKGVGNTMWGGPIPYISTEWELLVWGIN